MSKKRPLTAEEKAMADRMKAILDSNADLTQEAVGAAVGVTQGQVWQWIEGRLPVSAKRAPALAEALGIADPGEISVAYREISRRPAMDGATLEGEIKPIDLKQSHAQRFDPWILSATHRAMRELHAEEGLPYNLEQDPEHFLKAYALHVELAQILPGADLVKLFRAAGLTNRQGASDNGRAGDGTLGLPDEGTHSSKMARKVQHKKTRS